MSGLRSPGLLGLVLLMLSAGYCKEKTDSTDLKDRQSLLNLIMEIIQELKRYHLEKDSGVQYFSKHDYTLDRREVADYGGYQDEQRVEIVPRDLRMKDKFLKHLTGPLYFSPKCSKHFHRLYHNTRDCTIPACKCQKLRLTFIKPQKTPKYSSSVGYQIRDTMLGYVSLSEVWSVLKGTK
ncbi:PREDICTED: protein FAM150B isoform X1 [Tinamus guttatus]|uniref:protein FAM150B isoform X1 n=1 Tax=Tinamus guttatus TaxID=94827 RepID=UPI00052ED060|nr:PREDICTED: protein FAM150B isoform X1 [Tinamus guttatus]